MAECFSIFSTADSKKSKGGTNTDDSSVSFKCHVNKPATTPESKVVVVGV